MEQDRQDDPDRGEPTFRATLTCVINPTLCRDREMTITPAAKPKKVLVAGGGPGGLEAARVAALRGHEVTLCEKDTKLGGQFNLAAVAPMKQELCKVIKYLSIPVEKANPAFPPSSLAMVSSRTFRVGFAVRE